MSLSSIVLLLQLALQLLSNQNLSGAARIQAVSFAGQAVTLATQALQTQVTTPTPAPTPAPQSLYNPLTQYNSEMTILNQEIINIENQYESDVSEAQTTSGDMSILNGRVAELYQQEQDAIAKVNIQEQQLQNNYQYDQNAFQNGASVQAPVTPSKVCVSYSNMECISWIDSSL